MSYSRLVALLKVLLPLIALAILSTLFLVARAPNVERELIFVEGEDTVGQSERLAAPSFQAVLADGSALSLSADVIRPDNAGDSTVRIERILLRIEGPDGRTRIATAEAGVLDISGQIARLDGRVVITTSEGAVLETRDISVGLGRGEAQTGGAITATGPFGRLTAGGMRLSQTDAGTSVLDFTDGIEMVYDPKETP